MKLIQSGSCNPKQSASFAVQEEPDQYHLKEGNVLKAESVLRQLAPPDEWCDERICTSACQQQLLLFLT